MTNRNTVLILLAIILMGAAIYFYRQEPGRSGNHDAAGSAAKPAAPPELAERQTPSPERNRLQSPEAPEPMPAPPDTSPAPLERAIEVVSTEAMKLLENWELSSFKHLDYASKLLSSGQASTAAIVLPPPDGDTQARLRQLLADAVVDSGGQGVSDSAFAEAKRALGWPQHSRIVLALAKPDGTDSLLLFENAAENDINIHPASGNINITGDQASFTPIDLEAQNRFSHLFQIATEE